MPSPSIRISAAAVALAAALLAAPAQAAGHTGHASVLAAGWQRLVRLIGHEGLGLDPNGYKARPINTAGTGGVAAAAGTPRTISTGPGVLP
jgi:hypothetical protein